MYAVLYCIHESIIEIQNRLEHNFSLFAEWLNENEIIVNTSGRQKLWYLGQAKDLANLRKPLYILHTETAKSTLHRPINTLVSVVSILVYI